MAVQKRTGAGGRVTYTVTVYSPLSASNTYIGSYPRRKDADLAESDAKRSIKLGHLLTKRDEITVADLATKWLGLVNVRATTHEMYSYSIKHSVAVFGKRRVSTLKRDDIEGYVGQLNASHLAPSTVLRMVNIFQWMLAAAVEWGYLEASPAAKLRNLPKKGRMREPRVLTREEHRRLVEAAPEYWRTLFEVWPMIGLRKGEMLGLRWRDVDAPNARLNIRQQLVSGRLEPPKTEASRRTVHLSKRTVETLSAWHEKCPGSEMGLVFPHPWGRGISDGAFYQGVFGPTVLAAGLEGLKPHDLRHTMVSWLIAQKADIKYIQHEVGHSSAQVTLDIYGHLLEEQEYGYADAMDAWCDAAPLDS